MRIQIIIVFVISVLAHAATAGAAERVDHRVNAPAGGTVEIENIAGSITVSGWDREEVHVTGEIDPGADEFVFENDGEYTRVKVKYPRGGFWNSERNVSGSELRVTIPRSSKLVISSVSASVDVDETDGPVEVETISGSMDIETGGKEIKLESISGSIRLGKSVSDARATVESISGDIRITGIMGELQAGSVSGDIDVARSRLNRAEMTNTSGDIEVEAEFAADGVYRLKAISGDIDVRFLNEPNANFDVTTFSGDIDNTFGPEPKKTGRYTPNMELKFRAGNGEGDFTINTMSGDIDIRR